MHSVAGLISQEHRLTWLMFALAFVRDILRPAPCEHELHDCAFPLPLVTKLPVPASTPQSSRTAENGRRELQINH